MLTKVSTLIAYLQFRFSALAPLVYFEVKTQTSSFQLPARSSTMLCRRCRVLFNGTVRPGVERSIIKDERTMLHISLTRPAVAYDCALCHRVDEQVRNNHQV